MIKKERSMKVKRFQKYGLIISFILFIFSCDNMEKDFYNKIEKNDDCMLACTVKYKEKMPIIVVMKKSMLIYNLRKSNRNIDNEAIIDNIKCRKPIEVSKETYLELYTLQVIDQYRVDSLFNHGIEQFFFNNHKNVKLLKPETLVNETSMEHLYIIKRLFDQRILLKRDCESGYYFEIK